MLRCVTAKPFHEMFFSVFSKKAVSHKAVSYEVDNYLKTSRMLSNSF